jgi:hypothetical protein
MGYGDIVKPVSTDPHRENENPGALAGATGADADKKTLAAEDYRMRAQCATALAEAIADCHPDDAVQIMTAALLELAPTRTPGDYFLSIEDDAKWWASVAPPAQLAAVLDATLANLGGLALHLTTRKRLLVSLFQSLKDCDRIAFLGRVDPAGRFVRRQS